MIKAIARGGALVAGQAVDDLPIARVEGVLGIAVEVFRRRMVVAHKLLCWPPDGKVVRPRHAKVGVVLVRYPLGKMIVGETRAAVAILGSRLAFDQSC